jgi:putative ABC transport system permease protein
VPSRRRPSASRPGSPRRWGCSSARTCCRRSRGWSYRSAATSRALIEARLALGLPGKAAFAPHRRVALRAALAPGLDQTKVVGLIALPGTMTGLIIAGVSPLTAIRYQVVVQYTWLGAVAISGLVAALVAGGGVFDEAHRLRYLGDTTRKAA